MFLKDKSQYSRYDNSDTADLYVFSSKVIPFILILTYSQLKGFWNIKAFGSEGAIIHSFRCLIKLGYHVMKYVFPLLKLVVGCSTV